MTDLNAVLLTAISFIKVPSTENNETNRKSGIAYAAALVLFTSVVSLCGAGWVLDRWLGTKPWLLVAGIVLGAIAGFYQFIRLTSQL